MSYFEDSCVGDFYVTPGRTITRFDVAAYASLSGDYDERHTNDLCFSEKCPVPPLFLFGVSHGLLCRTGILEGPGGVAFAGVEDLRFLGPVYVGDTVHGEIHVAKMQISRSKPDRGLVYYDFTLVNQDGAAVQRSVKKIMKLVRAKAGEG